MANELALLADARSSLERARTLSEVKEITWSDGQGQERYVSCDELVQLFRFDLSPDTLRPLEHREHKRRVEAPASLFDEVD